jgi:hypothetical protein
MWDFVVGSLIFLLFTAVIVTWIFTMVDIFARRDIGWLKKALWVVAIIFFPFIGMLIYFAFRPRDARWWASFDEEAPIYNTRDWQIGELETLTRLRDQGTITDDEFARMKERVMAVV